MKRFEMKDVMYFGLYAVAFVLLLLNALHAGKERKKYREQMSAIEAKLDALASSTDALGTRIDTLEQGLASSTDANKEALDGIEELKKSLDEEVERINKKIKEVEEAKLEKKRQAEEAAAYAASSYVSEGGDSSGYTHPFRSQGTTNDGTYNYTWYSQRVLPGGGLSIPGRHVDADGFVRDESGNLCIASRDLDKGTEVDTPFGKAVVYDYCPNGNLDIYTDW